MTLHFLFLCCLPGIFAQDSDSRFINISGQLGMLHASINDIYQDKSGFLWLATSVGLYRYDGYMFKAYRHDVLDSTSLSSPQVWSVTGDAHDRIVVGTMYGVNILDRRTGKFTRLFPTPGEPSTKSINMVRAVHTDVDGQLWAAGNLRLLRYDPKAEKFDTITCVNAPDLQVAGRAIYETPDGTIWWGTNAGLLEIVRNNSTSYFHDLTPETGEASVRDIVPGPDNDLYLATSDGVVRFDMTNRVVVDRDVIPGLRGTSIRRLISSHDGTLVFAVTGDGIRKFHQGSGSLQVFRHVDGDPGSLPSNDIRSLMEDRLGNIWVGTVAGLLKMPPATSAGRLLLNSSGPNSLVNHVLRIVEAQDGTLWVMTPLGLYKKTPGQRKAIPVEVIRTSAEYEFGDALYEDAHGVIWLGIDGHGLFRKSPGKPGFERVKSDDRFARYTIFKIIGDNEDRDVLWLGTANGFCRFNSRNLETEWHIPRDDLPDAPNNRLSVFEQSGSDIWVYYTSYNAVGRFSKSSGTFNIFRPPADKEFALEGIVRDMVVSADSNVWIAGSYGLTRYNIETGEFKLYERRNGLPDEVLYAVVLDHDNRLWVSGQQLYAEFDRESEQFRIYPNTEIESFWSKSKHLSDNGRIYFGGFNGIYTFHPDSLIRSHTTPTIVLTDLRIGDTSYILPQAPELLEHIELTHDQNDIEFSFAGLHFVDPAANQYQCMLEGVDNAWRQLGTHRSINYSNLDPGSYTFRVNASNSDGIWTENGLQIPITIHPPFTQTNWFKLLVVILAAALLYIVYRAWSYQNSLRQQKELAERTSEYRMRFLSHVSHEIRTPMNAIVGLSSILRGTSLNERQQRMVSAIDQSSQNLLKIINELLDYSKIESEMFSFKSEPFSLRAIVEQLRSLFNTLAREKDLELHILVADDAPDALTGDSLRLTQILTNILGNAIKYTDKGSVAFSVECEQGNNDSVDIIFKIRDTGVGIPRDKLDSIFERFSSTSGEMWQKSTGLGLYITRELIERQGGSIAIDSVVGEGTVFTIMMPYETSDVGVPLTGNIAREYDLSNLRVLLVDDAPFNHLVVGEMLREKVPGVVITSVSDGLEAVEALPAGQFDLVIMDARMPGMDGNTATRKIRQMGGKLGNTPILGATASAMPAEISQCLESGMNDVVAKPILVDDLMEKIHRLLNGNKS